MSRAIAGNVLWLGVVSLFADIASDMVMPLLPAFLVSLGGGAAFLGLVEGAAEAISSVMKFASGRWADRASRLRPLAVMGYALAGGVRPLLALAGAPWHVLAVRSVDRVGKGLRTSPRDKLLAASAPAGRLAEAFSFHRGMDHLGAALGPLVAAGILALWPGRIRLVFALAVVPGALAVLAFLAVRERGETAATVASNASPTATPTPTATTTPNPLATPNPIAHATPGSTAGLLFAIGLFTLGNSTDALLLLRAQDMSVPTAQLPLLWTLLHALRALASWPLGRLADRLGRARLLAAGWAWYALCYAGFAAAGERWHAWTLFAAYGLVAGLTEGGERALVAAASPPDRRGRGLGLYHLVSGLGLLAASLLAGEVWERVSAAAALGLGAALAAAAAVALLGWSARAGPAAT